MKVIINGQGLYSVEAENASDNTLLFSIVNSGANGAEINFPQAEQKKPKGLIERVLGKHNAHVVKQVVATEMANRVEVAQPTKRKYKKRAVQYKKHCRVEGCEYSGKGIATHMYKAHGVMKDGTQVTEVRGNGGKTPVKVPVILMPDGAYRVKPTANLLG